MAVRVVSWNIDGMVAPWNCLVEMNADVALLQEASEPPRRPGQANLRRSRTMAYRWMGRMAAPDCHREALEPC